jgi:hypothetical protein
VRSLIVIVTSFAVPSCPLSGSTSPGVDTVGWFARGSP